MRTIVSLGLLLLVGIVIYVFQNFQIQREVSVSDADQTTHSAATYPNGAPIAKRVPTTREYHGLTLSDPYAWLKDDSFPEVDDPEVIEYLEAENAHFEAFMAPLQDEVETIFAELKARQPDEDASVPYQYGEYWYQWRFAADAQYRTWYRAPAANPEQYEVLLDERELADGLDYFRLGEISVSPDATKLAYSTDTDGSERFTLHVINLADRSPATTPIANTLDEVVWASDSNSLLYTIVSEEWRPYRVLLRKLEGASTTDNEAQDPIIFEETDTGYFVGLSTSQSERYAMIESGDHTTNETHVLALDDLTGPLKMIEPRHAGHEYFVDHRLVDGQAEDAPNGQFVIRSNLRQANFDIYTADPDQPGQDNWQRIVDGSPQRYITGHAAFSNVLVLTERIDGLDQINLIDNDSGNHYVEFSESAYSASLGTNPNANVDKLRVGYSSMATPNTVYDYDLDTRELETLKIRQIPSGYDPAKYTTSRLLISARDDTLIPVSIMHKVDTPLDGSAPLYLYGYGAYGISIPPSFSTSRISLIDRGFVYAIAHIRGGDDLGYDWYTQGKLDRRTNTFNDFVDVARAMIDKNYTSAGRIAIAGGSAGGELMGAVVNQAPELWGAVAAHVPFVDVLNTMLDDSLPLTPMEWPEWGNPIEDKAAFEYIQSYSPYDQLSPGAFPPMMVTAGLNDPRVTYWEPAKYVAKLRHLKTGDSPLILKTNMGAGHGGKSGRFEALRELAEEYAFFLNQISPDS